MKFCQIDGTRLVEDAPIGGRDDPFRTALGEPSDFDPMKTMLSSNSPLDAPPPSPFGEAAQNEMPKPVAPSFGDLSSPQFGDAPHPTQSYGENQPSGGYNAPPTFQEPESPFGNQAGYNAPPINEWSPPPAPQNWGNQGLGQDTPFGAPPTPVGAKQSQGLAIAAMVCGILSCLCCLSVLTGPAGLIMGFIARGNAAKQPDVYGGANFALVGIITGAIGTLLCVVLLIIQILGAIAR
jgi:hypothetical protein